MDDTSIRQALDAIAAVDEDVRRGLQQVGYPAPRVREPGFETLLAIIVSQQLSTQVSAVIMGRIRELMPQALSAKALLELPDGALRECGLSARKVEYATGLALAIEEGRFDPQALGDLSDQDAIDAIVSLRGFGRWSAEIYTMFALQRPDVFAADDLALQVALQRLKGLQQRPTMKQARELTTHWSPWRTAGSLFLWHFYQGAPA